MTLTEKWRKGELKAGWYYVLLFSNEEYITFIDGNWVVDDRLIGADIKQILTPIPSCEEYNRLKEVERKKGKLVNVNYKIKQENQQLKTLLKEWMHFYPIILYEHEDTLKTKDIVELFDKTANAIGEKK
jgi:hypothetical protein